MIETVRETERDRETETKTVKLCFIEVNIYIYISVNYRSLTNLSFLHKSTCNKTTYNV